MLLEIRFADIYDIVRTKFLLSLNQLIVELISCCCVNRCLVCWSCRFGHDLQCHYAIVVQNFMYASIIAWAIFGRRMSDG